MIIRSIVLAGLVAIMAGPAAAQPRWGYGSGYPDYYEGLPTRVIMRIVRSRGFHPVARPRRHGSHYLVAAEDKSGRVRRVVIDARSGRVLRVEAIGRREFREPRTFAMRPPRSVPESRRDIDDDEMRLPPAPRHRLPPLRPRASLTPPEADTPEAITGPEDSGPQALPPPPRAGERRAAPTQQPAAGGSQRPSTSTNPASPPIPRPRPAAAPETTGATATADPPAAAKQEGSTQKHKSLPRVVLPGGPLPKTQRTADTRPGQREHDASKPGETSAAPAQPAAEAQKRSQPAMPPVQGLE